jgi:WS/DGAT/MGAT family acyltransferase
VQSTPANLTPPLWVEDPDFSIDYHVRRIAVPAPGTMRQALDIATLITADPFDRTRPLWQFVVIEGLENDQALLVEKLHHTIADGEGSVQLSLQFFDFERDAADPPPLDASIIGEVSAQTNMLHTDLWRDLLAGPFKMPVAIVKQIRDLLADPTHLPSNGSATIESLRGLLGQLTDVDPAKSPVWTSRTLKRHSEVLEIPFAETREVARSLGGTLNTILLTAASDASGRYHRDMGSPIDHLRASMAISTRKESQDGSQTNAFSLARLLVPTGEMKVKDRFELVHQATLDASSASGSQALNAISALSASLPTGILTRIARLQSQTVDFATSNVKGTPVPVFVAGAEIINNFPLGPIGGVAFNLTLLSHVGHLDMGLHMDSGAIEHPQLLHQHLKDSFAELLHIKTKKSPTSQKTKKK